MKKIIFLMLLIFPVSFVLFSCEKITGTEQSVGVSNFTSHKLLMSYKTSQREETVELSDLNGRGSIIYRSYWYEGEFPKFTEAEFLEIVKDVRISVITETGDTIPMSKNFAADYNAWEYMFSIDDETNIHGYSLNLTDDDID